MPQTMTKAQKRNIETGHKKSRCKICKDDELREKFDSLYMYSGRAPAWCSEECQVDRDTGAAHVAGTDLRRRRYGDTLRNIHRFIELCEDQIAQDKVPITSHAFVNALRLESDVRQAALKSHPGVMMFLNLPKPIQDALTEVMRATSTSDEALAALGTAAEVGAGTVEEAEEPPDEVETAKVAGRGSDEAGKPKMERSTGLPSGSKPKPIVVKGGEEPPSSLGPCEFGPIDKDDKP